MTTANEVEEVYSVWSVTKLTKGNVQKQRILRLTSHGLSTVRPKTKNHSEQETSFHTWAKMKKAHVRQTYWVVVVDKKSTERMFATKDAKVLASEINKYISISNSTLNYARTQTFSPITKSTNNNAPEGYQQFPKPIHMSANSNSFSSVNEPMSQPFPILVPDDIEQQAFDFQITFNERPFGLILQPLNEMSKTGAIVEQTTIHSIKDIPLESHILTINHQDVQHLPFMNIIKALDTANLPTIISFLTFNDLYKRSPFDTRLSSISEFTNFIQPQDSPIITNRTEISLIVPISPFPSSPSIADDESHAEYAPNLNKKISVLSMIKASDESEEDPKKQKRPQTARPKLKKKKISSTTPTEKKVKSGRPSSAKMSNGKKGINKFPANKKTKNKSKRKISKTDQTSKIANKRKAKKGKHKKKHHQQQLPLQVKKKKKPKAMQKNSKSVDALLIDEVFVDSITDDIIPLVNETSPSKRKKKHSKGDLFGRTISLSLLVNPKAIITIASGRKRRDSKEPATSNCSTPVFLPQSNSSALPNTVHASDEETYVLALSNEFVAVHDYDEEDDDGNEIVGECERKSSETFLDKVSSSTPLTSLNEYASDTDNKPSTSNKTNKSNRKSRKLNLEHTISKSEESKLPSTKNVYLSKSEDNILQDGTIPVFRSVNSAEMVSMTVGQKQSRRFLSIEDIPCLSSISVVVDSSVTDTHLSQVSQTESEISDEPLPLHNIPSNTSSTHSLSRDHLATLQQPESEHRRSVSGLATSPIHNICIKHPHSHVVTFSEAVKNVGLSQTPDPVSSKSRSKSITKKTDVRLGTPVLNGNKKRRRSMPHSKTCSDDDIVYVAVEQITSTKSHGAISHKNIDSVESIDGAWPSNVLREEYFAVFTQRPFGMSLKSYYANDRGAYVSKVKEYNAYQVKPYSVILSVNGERIQRYTYKTIKHTLDRATLPCRVRFVFGDGPSFEAMQKLKESQVYTTAEDENDEASVQFRNRERDMERLAEQFMDDFDGMRLIHKAQTAERNRQWKNAISYYDSGIAKLRSHFLTLKLIKSNRQMVRDQINSYRRRVTILCQQHPFASDRYATSSSNAVEGSIARSFNSERSHTRNKRSKKGKSSFTPVVDSNSGVAYKLLKNQLNSNKRNHTLLPLKKKRTSNTKNDGSSSSEINMNNHRDSQYKHRSRSSHNISSPNTKLKDRQRCASHSRTHNNRFSHVDEDEKTREDTNTNKKKSKLSKEDEAFRERIAADIISEAPDVTFKDVQGLVNVKLALYESIILPALRPDVFTGLRAPATGLLLFGPPGNGKTMIAKCVAAECACTFFSISASSITSKFVGDAERIMRTLFTVARERAPSIIFIDEIDSLLTARGGKNEAESSRRIKTEFLVQFDGVKASTEIDAHVLIIGATNLPQQLDEAVLRRFQKRILVPLPDGETREGLLRTLIRQQRHELSNSDFQTIVQSSVGYSCSDLANVCKDAAMGPVRDMGALILDPNATMGNISVKHFQNSLKNVKPSLPADSVAQYDSWNNKYGSKMHLSINALPESMRPKDPSDYSPLDTNTNNNTKEDIGSDEYYSGSNYSGSNYSGEEYK